MVSPTVISVKERPKLIKDKSGVRPAHHVNDTKSAFRNPWPSYREPKFTETVKLGISMLLHPVRVPQDIEQQLNRQARNGPYPWGVDTSTPSTIKATWVGHAGFYVELPTPDGAERGARILFDPMWSKFCSPSPFVKLPRYSKPPCELTDFGFVDVVILSHNHSDHMDTKTLKQLETLYQPHFFAPLGNGAYFKSLKIPAERVHCMDWWDSKEVTLINLACAFAVTCTPAQHGSGRGFFDKSRSLWASWAVEDVPSGRKVWFGGDTGYRAAHARPDIAATPECPIFKTIGETFGGFDLALISIGTYQPPARMSAIHCSPEESVLIFKDVKATRALGMHWGAWKLSTEAPMDPPRQLVDACDKAGIGKGAFDVAGLGAIISV